MDSASRFTYNERLLIAALPPGPTKQFFHARMESAMSLKEDLIHGSRKINFTPFPRVIQEILRSHNATQIVVQVGTSSSHSFGYNPLDSIEPWYNAGQRVDLGPSGVSIRATFLISNIDDARAHWEALLHELVAQRVILAPLFSLPIQRLHRHWISWTDEASSNVQHFQLILPMEGASLSSEGMYSFVTAFSPCHNQSGILNWNSPTAMSELFVKRQSAERHSWWVRMDQEAEESGTTITRIAKGMQFQPFMDFQENSTVTLSDVFPASKTQSRCPFVQKTVLETVVSTMVPAQLSPSDEANNTGVIDWRPLSSKNWKEPWMTMLSSSAPRPNPYWSVQQTLQRPRGVSYAGKLITQITVKPFEDCPVSVDLQWFLPPIVQPIWKSLRVIHEDTQEQVERELDWRSELRGSITTIDPSTGRSRSDLGFDDGTIYFHIPQWNMTGAAQQTLTISLDYRPAFLSFEHFPGDANRGVEIPPAVATFYQHCISPSTPIQLYSNSLLLLPPVPDMSMPFNVLSMTCSLYAFVIGSMLNLMIRKSSERVQGTYDPSKIEPSKLKVLVGKVKDKLAALKRTIRKGKGVEGAEEVAAHDNNQQAAVAAQEDYMTTENTNVATKED